MQTGNPKCHLKAAILNCNGKLVSYLPVFKNYQTMTMYFLLKWQRFYKHI